MSNSDAYNEGYSAGWIDAQIKASSENPYDEGTKEYKDYERGYVDGQEDWQWAHSFRR